MPIQGVRPPTGRGRHTHTSDDGSYRIRRKGDTDMTKTIDAIRTEIDGDVTLTVIDVAADVHTYVQVYGAEGAYMAHMAHEFWGADPTDDGDMVNYYPENTPA